MLYKFWIKNIKTYTVTIKSKSRKICTHCVKNIIYAVHGTCKNVNYNSCKVTINKTHRN